MQYPGRAMTLGNIYKNFRKYLVKAGITDFSIQEEAEEKE